MANLALPDSTSPTSLGWKGADGKYRPEFWTACLAATAVGGLVLYFWSILVPWLINMLTDTLHMAYLAGLLIGILYLLFGKRPRLIFRVLIRKLTSLFVAVYPIEIIEDKLLQMKKRKEKMDQMISLVRGAMERLKRVMGKNQNDYTTGMQQAIQAHKMAGTAEDATIAARMELQTRLQARRAQRRQDANIGYANLLERITKLYNFLTRYSDNVQFLVEDTQDEIDQKKTEYETTQSAFGAMKQAMSVIRGNATEEDIYDQAFAQIETTISTQLGMMDDMQRISQNFMDGMDVEKGAVDERALDALNAFEQKLLSSSKDPAFKMLTTDMSKKQSVPVPAKASSVGGGQFNTSEFDDLLK